MLTMSVLLWANAQGAYITTTMVIAALLVDVVAWFSAAHMVRGGVFDG